MSGAVSPFGSGPVDRWLPSNRGASPMRIERTGWIAALACIVAGLPVPAAYGGGGQDPKKPVDFAHDVAPLIKAKCANCHTDGRYKGSFSLDTREAMLKSKSVVPGKPDESELLERLTSTDPEFRMPPPEGKEKPL